MRRKTEVLLGLAGVAGSVLQVADGAVESVYATGSATCNSPYFCVSAQQLSGTTTSMSPGWKNYSNDNPYPAYWWVDLYSQTFDNGVTVGGYVKSARNRDTINGATFCLYYADAPEVSHIVAEVKYSYVGWKSFTSEQTSLINVAARAPGSYPASRGSCPYSPFW